MDTCTIVHRCGDGNGHRPDGRLKPDTGSCPLFSSCNGRYRSIAMHFSSNTAILGCNTKLQYWVCNTGLQYWVACNSEVHCTAWGSLTPAIICCRSRSDPRFAFLPDTRSFGRNHSTPRTFWDNLQIGRSNLIIQTSTIAIALSSLSYSSMTVG